MILADLRHPGNSLANFLQVFSSYVDSQVGFLFERFQFGIVGRTLKERINFILKSTLALPNRLSSCVLRPDIRL